MRAKGIEHIKDAIEKFQWIYLCLKLSGEYFYFTKVLCIEVDGDQDSWKKHLESSKILAILYHRTGLSDICRKRLEKIKEKNTFIMLLKS